MSPSPRHQVEQVFRIARKWRRYGVIPAVLVFVCCVAYALVVPTYYTASTMLSVDPDSPTNPLLRDLNVDQRRQERLAVVAESIHSYAILERTVQDLGTGTIIADSTDLVTYVLGTINDRLIRSRAVSTSQAVEALDAAIRVKQWGRDLIEVRYTGLDPTVAATAANTLVNRFIEHSAAARRRGALATVEFITEQVGVYQTRLETSEVLLRTFREENLEAAPNQFNTQVQALTAIKTEEITTGISLREIEQRIAFIEEHLAQTDEKIVAERITSANPMVQEIEARLVEARVQLATLRTNYTDRHPEIIRLKDQVVNLEGELAMVEDTTVTSETSTVNPIFARLVQTLQDARIERESLTLRLEAVRGRIGELEGSIGAIPGQEQHLAQLTRDSQVNERIYELLLRRLQEAKISQQLAEQERGSEQFRIIDPARVPEAPAGPNRIFLIAFAVVAAGGAGAGGIMARHYVDESYDDAEQLAAAFDLPCLAVIPRLDRIA